MKKLSAKKFIAAFAAASMIFCSFISCATDDDDGDSVKSGSKPESTYDDSALPEATLFVVGDSTVCNYLKEDGTHTDNTYMYPRYGYGTQLDVNLSSKITVKNLALSGRSSKSFMADPEYATLKSSIKAGDYLVIGFGHNDEKSDDSERFADASKSTSTEGSFKYNLYNYYAKVALDAGATPILCTPIVRLSAVNDYSAATAHITANGDYAQAIVDLGTEKNIQVVNLRDLTKELYTKLTYNEAVYFHAIATGESSDGGTTVTPKFASADTTHINIYGAKMVSYLFAKTIKASSCSLSAYVKQTYEPTKAVDLEIWKNYKYAEYTPPALDSYEPKFMYETKTEGWYGTAFGDTGGDPSAINEKGENTNQYWGCEETAGTFKVGTTKVKGKISSGSEGFAFVFQQIPVSKNFTLTASAKITGKISTVTNQTAFGLMLRDDCYLPVKDASIKSNYVAAGLLTEENEKVRANFSRETGSLVITDSTGGDTNQFDSYYAVDETAELTIERVGQVVKVKTVFRGKTYEKTYTDFDFVAKDTAYFYAGMFATRGTLIDFTNVVLTITGESQGA